MAVVNFLIVDDDEGTRDTIGVLVKRLAAQPLVPVAVQAMQLGALTVIEKQVEFETLEAAIRTLASAGSAHGSAGMLGSEARGCHHGGLAERWARLIFRTLETAHDFRTVGEWGRVVGMSGSSVREVCRLLHIRPRLRR